MLLTLVSVNHVASVVGVIMAGAADLKLVASVGGRVVGRTVNQVGCLLQAAG